ncbi:MAG: hypothetical protein U0793_12000 [Gemmataceae bacterium]
MFRYALPILAAALAIDLVRFWLHSFPDPGIGGALLFQLGCPSLAVIALIQGGRLGVVLDRFLCRNPPDNAPSFVRSWGFLQALLAAILLFLATKLFPDRIVPDPIPRYAVGRTSVFLLASGIWLLFLKGWFELLAGISVRRVQQFWRSLTPGRKLAFVTVYYGSSGLLLLLPSLYLVNLVLSLSI